MKTIFSPADILLPPYSPESDKWAQWSVIACDQFTSEPEYWKKAEEIVADTPSTLNYILPEAYLETEKEKEYSEKIKHSMMTVSEKLKTHENCMIYVERTLPDGKVRRGIVGKLDLEAYDFTPDSASPIRATEKTVLERIPPRVAVRKSATVEFPHIMVFADDSETMFVERLSSEKGSLEKIYDFELMLGGGRIAGWKVCGEALEALLGYIEEYENEKLGGVVYAMGDGNHSLASAKAHYENIKKQLGQAAETHPARYALAEIVSLNDESIEFEPIYRILKNCDPDDVIRKMELCAAGENKVTVVTGGEEAIYTAPGGHPLTVGALQQFVDGYIKENPAVVCDYIHGRETLKLLAESENAVGFLFDGVEKSELFAYVAKNGTLPRKTFSMGEAKSKRYYLEARKIVL